MQDNVDIYTEALIRGIKESREYREFCEAKMKLAKLPELKKQIHNYRRDTYRLQNFSDEETLYERIQEFNEQHAQFRKNPLVNDYLSSELAVCRMLQRVMANIVESVDLELEHVARGIHS